MRRIEVEKSIGIGDKRGTIRKVAGRLVGPVMAAALIATALGTAGCGDTKIYTDHVDIYGAKTPSEAAGTPVPTETEQAFARGVAAGAAGTLEAATNNLTAAANKLTTAAEQARDRNGRARHQDAFPRRPRPIETPRPIEIPSSNRGTSLILNPGYYSWISGGSVISGDVSVNNARLYDDDSTTGLEVVLLDTELVGVPFGASASTGLNGRFEMDMEANRLAGETFRYRPEINRINVLVVQGGQVVDSRMLWR